MGDEKEEDDEDDDLYNFDSDGGENIAPNLRTKAKSGHEDSSACLAFGSPSGSAATRPAAGAEERERERRMAMAALEKELGLVMMDPAQVREEDEKTKRGWARAWSAAS